MTRRPRDSDRGTTTIVVLLLLSLALAGGVAWQAYDAARSHRRAAEAVLRDYAGLAADEVIRRASSQVGFYGYFRLLEALRERGVLAGAALPARDQLVEADERLRQAVPLVHCFFTWQPEDGSLQVDGTPISPAVEHWLRQRLVQAMASEDESRIKVLHGVIEGEAWSAAFVRPRDPRDGRRSAGLVVDRRGLAAMLDDALDRGSIVPPSLGDAPLANEQLSVRIADATGRPWVDRRTTHEIDPYRPTITAERPFGAAYNGVLEGATVQVALPAEAAPYLVIGGLPRSRLPVLFGLLAATTGLVVTAILQLRRARRLARLRADFVAEVSHELRTPLTQIRMFAETLLLGRVRSDAERTRALGIIDRESRRLGHLVENVLQFARGERDAVSLDRAPRHLAPLVEQVVEELTPLASGKQVVFRSELDQEAVADVDADAFRQILLNLLDNALKYGPDAQTVRIALTRDEPLEAGTVRLAVSDQGPGVPRSERRRIWRSYRRIDRDRRAAIAGTGIGLAVVDDLVRRHDGRAWVEPSPEGGACFVVRLPRATATGPPSAAPPAPRAAHPRSIGEAP